jgi:hypothetical protein
MPRILVPGHSAFVRAVLAGNVHQHGRQRCHDVAKEGSLNLETALPGPDTDRLSEGEPDQILGAKYPLGQHVFRGSDPAEYNDNSTLTQEVQPGGVNVPR